MAVCEANISNINTFTTESGLQVGEEMGSDRSKDESSEKAVLIQTPKSPRRKRVRPGSGSCEQQRRHSPRLSNVRNKTISHGGQVDSGDSSEDSDPNIHLNGIPDLDDHESDLALLEEEEKRQLMAKDIESGNEHMSENEMVAIAIYNSLEKKGGKNTETRSGDKDVQQSNTRPVKQEPIAISKSHEKNEPVTVTSSDKSYSGVATRLRKRQRNESMTCLKEPNGTDPRSSKTNELNEKAIPTQINATSASLSVPNPILMSPQGQTISAMKQEQSHSRAAPIKRTNNHSGSILLEKRIIITPEIPLSMQSSKTEESDPKSAVPQKSTETNKNPNTNCVSFKVGGENKDEAITNMPRRKRIFSIDFDRKSPLFISLFSSPSQ